MKRLILVVASTVAVASFAQKAGTYTVQGEELLIKSRDASMVTLTTMDGGATFSVPPAFIDELGNRQKEKVVADSKVEEAEKKAEKAESSESQLRNGKFISLGVTGGVGAAVLTPLATSPTQTLQAGTSALPYVVLVPAYWGYRQAAREYCSASWGGGSESDANKSATAVSMEAADRVVAVLEQFSTTTTEAELTNRIGITLQGDLGKKLLSDNELIKQIRAFLKADEAGRKTQRQVLQKLIAALDWDPTTPAYCLPSKFGVWVGIPTTVQVRSVVITSATPDAIRPYNSVLAFGLAFIPNAYVSALFGVAFGNLIDGQKDGNLGTAYNVWTFAAGLGGNLDVVSFLTGTAKSITSSK